MFTETTPALMLRTLLALTLTAATLSLSCAQTR